MKQLEEKYYVYQNENFVAAVPPFARYAYEVWIIPKNQIEGPWKFNDNQIEDFSKCIQRIVKGYDTFLNKKCPYIMGLHASPELSDNNFHFHVEFYPPLRHGDKPKILAGNRRYYDVKTIEIIKNIKFLLKDKGMTIQGVKKQLDNDETDLDETVNISINTKNILKTKLNKISKLIKDIKK